MMLDGIGMSYHYLLVTVCHDSTKGSRPKNFWCCSGSFLFPRTQANWQSEVEVSGYASWYRLAWSFAEARPMGGHVMFRGSISRTQWRACIASFAELPRSRVFTSLQFIGSMAENFSWCLCWSILLTCADLVETWLFVLDRPTTADSCLLSSHYWTGLLVSWHLEIEIAPRNCF